MGNTKHSVNILYTESTYAVFLQQYSHAADVYGRRCGPLTLKLLRCIVVAIKRESACKRECSIL